MNFASPSPIHSEPSFTELISSSTLHPGVYFIQLNRPKKKNAFNVTLMQEIIGALEYAKSSSSIRVVVVTGGTSDFFSSGNDLTNFQQMEPNEDGVRDAKKLLYNFVDTFITFPKPLIAAVNGPAVGIGCTILAHFDYIYAYERATFNTPFTELGQTPEACSSFLFPVMLGRLRANEILTLGKKFTAIELKGLYVTDTLATVKSTIDRAVEVARLLADSPSECVTSSKRLTSAHQIEFLQKVNYNEVEELGIRWQSNECMEAIMKFLTRSRAPRSAKL